MKQQLKFNRNKRYIYIGDHKHKIIIADNKRFEEDELKQYTKGKATEEDIVEIRANIPLGYFDKQKNEIWINKKVFDKKDEYRFEELMIHEITHAILYYLGVEDMSSGEERYIRPFSFLFYSAINQLIEKPVKKKKSIKGIKA